MTLSALLTVQPAVATQAEEEEEFILVPRVVNRDGETEPMTEREFALGAAYREIAALLNEVKNRITADAAAEKAAVYMRGIEALNKGTKPQWMLKEEPLSYEDYSRNKFHAEAGMKRLKHLSFYGSTALAQATGHKQEDAVIPTKEQIEQLQAMATGLRTLYRVMDSVKDKQTADEAAVKIEDEMKKLVQLAASVKLPRENLSDSLSLVKYTEIEQQAIERLEHAFKQRFYFGSKKLARAMHEDESQAIEVSELSDEKRATLSKEIMERVSMLFSVSGGPGFTQETAYIISNSSASVVRLEYKIMDFIFERYRRCAHSLVRGNDGRTFERHIIWVQIDDSWYSIEQWFDISPYALKQLGK